MLEDLTKIAEAKEIPLHLKPAFEFDGTEGVAQLPPSDGVPNFDDFLVEQGFDPSEFEIIGNPRTSRWQRYDGQWLTSYRFHFRRKTSDIDLPLLYAQAKRTKKPTTPTTSTAEKAVVIAWSDLQVGKVASRGGTTDLIRRVEETNQKLFAMLKREKPSKVLFLDVGDVIEGFENAADLQQLSTNDLSLMQQVDLATTLAWDTLKGIAKYTPEIVYASIGSNHCQARKNKQRIGRPADDWGIMIGRTLARLSKETGLPITFYEPAPDDESLVLDVFGDNFHLQGLVHGHQTARPDSVPTWWRQQAFGRQPVADATILLSGHYHHLRVVELGSTRRGTSRFWIQAATMDNGSDWFRMMSGEDSQPGLVTYILEKGIEFTGTVYKL